MLELGMREIGMSERGSIAIELFPICFRDQRFQMLEQRRTWIWSQDFEQRKSAAQIDRIIDRRADALDRVRKKTEHIESFRRDSQTPAIINDFTLVCVRNWTPADAFQCRRIH